MHQRHRVTLLIEPGRMMKRGQAKPVLHGVPYGARARMILLFLQTQAVRTCGSAPNVNLNRRRRLTPVEGHFNNLVR